MFHGNLTRTGRNSLAHAGVDCAVVDRAVVVLPGWIVAGELTPVQCSVSDTI